MTMKRLFLAAPLVLITACATEDPQRLGEPVMEEKYSDVTYKEKVARKPGKFLGNKVQVKGEVEEVVGNGIYLVDMDGIQGFHDIYVLDSTNSDVKVKQGDTIEAFGVMDVYATSEVKTEYEDKLLSEIDIDINNEPVIHAQTIKGYWDEKRRAEQPKLTVIVPQSQPSSKSGSASKSDTKSASKAQARQDEGNCEVIYRTPGAVGNPCDQKGKAAE